MHVFATIVINEAEYLAQNLRQHYEFCDRWIIVEGAVQGYPTERVTADGLSTDGTADIIRSFPDPDKKLRYIPAGTQASKEALRDIYAQHMPATAGTVIVFDADEFLRKPDLAGVLQRMRAWSATGAYRIPHVHFWHNASQIIRGGYFDIPHNRIYRWERGAGYKQNHNHPERPDGTLLHTLRTLAEPAAFEQTGGVWQHPRPCFLHYGFCKTSANMADKTKYYESRGELVTRPQTMQNRHAWFGEETPAGCQILPWSGGQPEVFE